jgi:hypothetical protein
MTPIELHAKHLGIMAWNMNYNGYSNSLPPTGYPSFPDCAYNRAVKHDVQLSAVRWGICMAGLDYEASLWHKAASLQWESS